MLSDLEGRDRLAGGPGDDWLNGGRGIDEALFGDEQAAYRITRSGDCLTVRHDGYEGTDTLENIERLVFADTVVLVFADTVVDVRALPDAGAVAASDYLFA